MANTDMRRKLAMMLDSYTVTASGIPPLSTYKRRLLSLKAFGGTEQRNIPDGYMQRQYIYMLEGSYIRVEDLPISAGYRVEFDFQTTSLGSALRNYLGGRAAGVAAGGGFRLSKLASGGTTLNRVVLYGFEAGTEYYDPTTQFQANTRYKYTYDNGVCTLESGGSVISTNTFTVTDNTSTDWGINDYCSNGTWSVYHDGMYVYSVKVWDDQGELVMDLVPCVKLGQVPETGFYDQARAIFIGPTAGTFMAGPEAPTPDVPVDIISNNGKLVFGETELPAGYKRLKDIIFDGEVYYVTDLYLTGADTTSFTINAAGNGRNVLGCYTGSNSGDNLSFYLSTGNNGTYVRYKNTLYRPVLANDKLNTDLTLSIGPTGTTGFDTDVTWTEIEFVSPDLLYIGWLANASSQKFLGTFKGNITVSDRATLIPCERTSDGAIGYYNINDNVFFENQGTGTPTTSGYDYSHYGVVADGTVETIEVIGHNLLDLANCTDGYYYSAAGVYSEASSARLSNFVKVKANESYTVFAYGLIGSANVRVNLFDTQKNWLSQTVIASTANQYKAITVTAVQDGYLAFSGNFVTSGSCIDWDMSQIVKGTYTVETMPEYEPYYDGGTATAEMLLKVGDYKDEQEILSGSITRNVGILVLDGTENWEPTSTSGLWLLRNVTEVVLPSTCFCNNFLGVSTTTSGSNMPDLSIRYGVTGYNNRLYIRYNSLTNVNELKQFLADQYDAGTPVIVLYPLATPTTETVAGQSMTFMKGKNTVDITQASLDNLELEIKAR